MFSDMGRKAAGLIAVAVFVSLSATSAGAAYTGMVEGVVKDSSGQPVAGAFVKLKNAERRLTFMVISQEQGRYTVDRLPAGQYSVQGVGGDFQSDWSAPVDVAEGRTSQHDISLTQQRAAQLTPAWPGRLPEEDAANATWPEGAGKEIATAQCVTCHDAGRTLARRQGRDGWHESVVDMRENMIAMGMEDLSDEEAETLTDYLTSNFPPMGIPDENSRLPRTLMTGESRNYRVVQYDLADVNAETHDIAVSPDGRGWANQRRGGKLSMLDPETYEHREFTPPSNAPRARMGNLQINSEGVVWLPENNDRRWLSFDIETAEWDSHPVPQSIRGSAGGNSMAFGEDGLVWNTGPGLAKSYNPETEEWNQYISPTGLSSPTNPGGYGIAVAGDGKVWFAMNNVDKLARVDPVTGQVDEFEIPVEGTAYPRRMTNDTDGNVWVSLWAAGKLMKIDYQTAEMSTYDPPSGKQSGVYSVDTDDTNNLIWMTLHRSDKIARFDPETEEWLEFPLPQAETDVRRVELDPSNPNRLWWCTTGNFGGGNARMGFVELLPPSAQ